MPPSREDLKIDDPKLIDFFSKISNTILELKKRIPVILNGLTEESGSLKLLEVYLKENEQAREFATASASIVSLSEYRMMVEDITTLKKQIQEKNKTVQNLQQLYREALSDLSKYEHYLRRFLEINQRGKILKYEKK